MKTRCLPSIVRTSAEATFGYGAPGWSTSGARRIEEEAARPAGEGRPIASTRGGCESEQQSEHDARAHARAHGWREPRHSPPHSAGVKSGEGGNCVKFTAKRDDRTTVTPSGKRRFLPSVTGGWGCPCLSNRTIDTLPHRVPKVTGSRFSSA